MSERTNKRDFKKTLALIGRGLRHLFLHNGWLKLIAIVISLFLWAGLISQDESITRDKAFQEVKVSVTGQEAMKGNGFIVTSDLDNIYADFVAAVPQKQYENADASFYNIRIDLSRINKTGEQELKLQSNKTNLYGGVNNNSLMPSSVVVNVEKLITRRIAVQAEYIDEEPEGWVYIPGECDPQYVIVSGPESILNAIFKAKALVTNDDVEWFSGSGKSVPVSFEFYNKDQEILDTSNLSITSANIPIDTLMVSYNVLAKKTFTTEDCANLTGKVAKGYEITKVTYSPESISVADSSEVLDTVDSILVEDTGINVNGLKATKSFPLKVLKPSENSIISNDTITVTVEIAETEEP